MRKYIKFLPFLVLTYCITSCSSDDEGVIPDTGGKDEKKDI